MDKRLKVALYLLLFGLLSVYIVLFKPPPRQNFSTAEVLGENTDLSLFIEPEEGREPLLRRISASNKVLTEVYLLSDPEIITAIASRSGQILLEEHPFGGNNLNQKTKTMLGSLVSWTNPAYALTHAKFMVFDNQAVCILNLNLTKTAFTKNREYNICSENKADVAEATNIFLADAGRQEYQPTDPHLVVSPVNSRGKLTALINSAQKTLDIEVEVINDDQLIELIAAKAKSIPVRLITPDKKSVDNPAVPNVQTKTLSSPYPHAKLIIADLSRAYTGSVNLSTQSLDRNRELGILVSQPDIIQRLNETFAKDWESANL
jgi:cardiolipin synthase A/B